MDPSDAPTAAPAAASEVARIRALAREHDFAGALAAAQAMLAASPGHRDALLFAALSQRCLGRIPEALRTLETLEQHHPGFSRLYEERGRCFVELRQAPQAIEAFLRAVNLNHALPGSWSMLEGLYRMTGDPANAAMAGSHVATMRKIPSEVVTATGLFMDGDLDAAESLVRAWLLKNGDHVEAMRLLARIGVARKIYDDPQLLLAAVLERAPDYRAAREEYAGVLIELHRHEEARRQVEKLLEDDPGNRRLRMLHAASYVGLGEHERAIAIYRELLLGTAEDAEVHLSVAHAQKTLGQAPEAIASYRKAAALRPDFGDAYWSLANLKTYRFTPAELAQMRTALAAPRTGAIDRYHLCFALAKALEDQGEYAESFHYYELGNRLKHTEIRYRPQMTENNTREQIQVCTAE
ncbi:MAG: tetratricopeptide repeat protein, partial [Gammaproteobacteria bacterium]|nr:tetratricopeptide repeat protein [Gammaproteobacteria bacterium]